MLYRPFTLFGRHSSSWFLRIDDGYHLPENVCYEDGCIVSKELDRLEKRFLFRWKVSPL
jgi:hypothetical protein